MLSALTSTSIGLWGPVIAYMAMLFGLSSLSTLPSPPAGLSFYDVHTAAYAGLAALTARATGRGLHDVSRRAVLLAILISSLYGVSDEYHQLFVPGRTFDVLDMLADAIGSVVGASAVGAWSILRRRF
ncbi:MAG TPA: VanZ family protein [Vicinamibacterales bacterium]